MLSPLTALALAALTLLSAMAPVGVSYRCVRMLERPTSARACCPRPALTSIDPEAGPRLATLERPCCENVAARHVEAAEPAARAEHLLVAPALLLFVSAPASLAVRARAIFVETPARGRPPGERLARLSSIQRV